MSDFSIAVDEEFEVEAEKGDTFEITDKREEGDPEKGIPAGVKICRYFKPNEGQVMVLMAATGRHSNDQRKTAAIIDFFAGVLDDDSYLYIERRLMNRADKFGLPHIEAILRNMMEKWSGRPTERSSDSSALLTSGGPNSTPTTLESTSSDFLSTVS